MMKKRFFQLMVIALLCMLVAGCKKEVKQADESPLPTMNQNDSSKVSSSKPDVAETETDNKEGISDDNAKESETAGKTDETSDNNNEEDNKDESATTEKEETPETANPSDEAATPGDEVKTDSVAIDTTVVDSLWDHLLVDAKIMSDTTLSQADSESIDRDSLLEAAKKQKLDSLLIGVIHPTDNTGTESKGAGGWPWWLTVLTGVAGLLLGGLLTWLISKFTRKKGSSSGDKKEEKPKFKDKEFDSDDVKNKKLIEFYKRMIIK